MAGTATMRDPSIPRPVPVLARQGWESPRVGVWTASVLAMMVLHAGALALAVWWHPQAEPAALPPAAMMIELAPLAAASASPRNMAPAIEQQAARPAKKVVEEPPRPEPVRKAEVPLPQPKPKPKQPPKPQPEPKPTPLVKTMAEAPPAETVVEHSTAPIATEAPVAPKMAAPASGAASSAPSNALSTWQGALRAHLERYKRYPSAAQARRQEGVSYVRFSMNRDGAVRWARLERTSGFSRLDDESLALMERAQPLPPPPSEVPGTVIEIVVPIEFFLK